METVEFYKRENNRLREIIGVWRRKAQDKAPRKNPEIIRESYSSGDRSHSVAYLVPNIPADLPFKEALKLMNEDFMPTVAPYTFSRLEYSGRRGIWIVTVSQVLQVDMERHFYDL